MFLIWTSLKIGCLVELKDLLYGSVLIKILMQHFYFMRLNAGVVAFKCTMFALNVIHSNFPVL